MESTENTFAQPVTKSEILDTWNQERDVSDLRSFVSRKLGSNAALASVDLGIDDYDLVA
jgi:hypothetical protein